MGHNQSIWNLNVCSKIEFFYNNCFHNFSEIVRCPFSCRLSMFPKDRFSQIPVSPCRLNPSTSNLKVQQYISPLRHLGTGTCNRKSSCRSLSVLPLVRLLLPTQYPGYRHWMCNTCHGTCPGNGTRCDCQSPQTGKRKGEKYRKFNIENLKSWNYNYTKVWD